MQEKNIHIAELVLNLSFFQQIMGVILIYLTLKITWQYIRAINYCKIENNKHDEFENKYWSGIDLMQLFKEVNQGKTKGETEKMFVNIMIEYNKIREMGEWTDYSMQLMNQSQKIREKVYMKALDAEIDKLFKTILKYGVVTSVYIIHGIWFLLDDQGGALGDSVQNGAQILIIIPAIYALFLYKYFHLRLTNEVTRLQNKAIIWSEEAVHLINRKAWRQ